MRQNDPMELHFGGPGGDFEDLEATFGFLGVHLGCNFENFPSRVPFFSKMERVGEARVHNIRFQRHFPLIFGAFCALFGPMPSCVAEYETGTAQ